MSFIYLFNHIIRVFGHEICSTMGLTFVIKNQVLMVYSVIILYFDGYQIQLINKRIIWSKRPKMQKNTFFSIKNVCFETRFGQLNGYQQFI